MYFLCCYCSYCHSWQTCRSARVENVLHIKITQWQSKGQIDSDGYGKAFTHRANANICHICEAHGPPNPLMLNQGCARAKRNKRGPSLLHWRWNTASPKRARSSNQAFRPRLHGIETNMCVCQPISVQTGCHLMMKWRGKHQTEGGTSAPVFLFSPVESSLPQSSSQWGSAWGGKCCFFRSVSPYPLIPSHDWQSWFRVYGVPF